MVSKAYYTPADASDSTGASKAALRLYTKGYARFFSTEATPSAGVTRKFTAADLKLIAYIRQQTALGATHEQIQAELDASALDSFDWQSPEDDATEASEPTSLMVPNERLQAAQALLLDSRQREDMTRQENASLRDRLEQLQHELGQAQGELSAYKEVVTANRPKRPQWWIRLFGE